MSPTPLTILRSLAAGQTQTQCACQFGTSQATVSRRLTDLCRRHPGLDWALAICAEASRREAERAARPCCPVDLQRVG